MVKDEERIGFKNRENDASGARSDADEHAYWRTRAERAKRFAARQDNESFCHHYLKIAAGYEELARRALASRENW